VSEPTDAEIANTLELLAKCREMARLAAEADAAKRLPHTYALLQLERVKFEQWKQKEAAKAARRP
jgi:hypothetical protein